MRLGLVGLQGAGKRCIFEALTGRRVEPALPLDKPVEGQTSVPDERVDRLADLLRSKSRKYAELDVALCPDVTGDDPKRAWLSGARNCDLLIGVIRAFEAGDVFHPKGSVSAERDREDIATELLLADLELVEKRLENMAKEKRSKGSVDAIEERTILKCRDSLEANRRLDEIELSEQELKAVAHLAFVTLKPIFWVLNVSENDVVKADADSSGDGNVLSICCSLERDIKELDAEERSAYLKEMGLAHDGVSRLLNMAYRKLGLISFLTAGEKETRAWTVRKGSPATRAGGKIHSDIERGFIRVEVIAYDDYIAAGSEAEAKKAGKAALKGKDYIVQDGDVCLFRFNV